MAVHYDRATPVSQPCAKKKKKGGGGERVADVLDIYTDSTFPDVYA